MVDCRATEATLIENEVANVTLDSIEEAVLRTDKMRQRYVSKSNGGKDDRMASGGGTGASHCGRTQNHRWH